MSFVPALTSDQLNTLRGTPSNAPTYYAATYVSVIPNTIIFRALVNQFAFAASYASVTFDNVTTGEYTDIVDGMRVYITPTTDLTNALRTGFTGRARMNGAGVVATSTVLNINESSTAIQDNWVITVVDDYPLLDRLGRQINGVQYVDFDIPYRKPKPVIYNLKSAYAQWVTGGVLSIAFAPLAFAVTSGASISSWLWDVVDGTITSGSSTTQNITAEFPPGFRWVFLRVTDSNGSTRTRKIAVFAHDPILYPPTPLQVGDLNVPANIESGYGATAIVWAAVENILDNTFVVFWSDEHYQDLDGSLLGDNINFVGRFRQSSDSSIPDLEVGQIAETHYTIEGVMQQLARIELLPYELDNVSTATSFFQVVNLTPWRTVCLMLSEFSTFLEVCSLSFDSLSNTFLGLGFRTQNGNILAVINDLYYSLNGAMQINPAAQMQFVRDLRMLGASSRNAAPTVINFDNRDLLSIDDYQHDNVRTVGRLKATGGSFLSAVNQYATFESLAPGVAQDYPEGSQSLDRQVLAANQTGASAQSELNTRTGYAFARAQNSDKISVTHPDGYASILIPSLDTWYTFTLDGSETVRGIVLTSAIRWLLVSVEIDHNAQEGEKGCKAVYAIETTGAAGQSVVYPPSQDTPYTEPSFPPFDPFPAFPVDPSFYLPPDTNVLPYTGDPTNQAVAPGDGNTVLIVDIPTNTVQYTTNYITGGLYPTWIDITPPGAVGMFVQHAIFALGSTRVYSLFTDGVNSHFFRCDNPFAAPPVWTETDVDTLYDTVVGGEHSNDVMLKGVGEDTSSPADLWSIFGSNHGTILDRDATTITIEASDLGVSGFYILIRTPDPLTCGLVTSYETLSGATDYCVSWTLCGEPQVEGHPQHECGLYTPTACVNYFQLQTGVGEAFTVKLTFGSSDDCGDPVVIASQTVFSSDGGVTFGTPRDISPSPSLGVGLDAIKIGSVSLVGTSGQTKVSTSGGAWSNYGTLFPVGAQPNGIVIPRYQFGGTITGNINTSTPQYLAASGTLGLGNAALWKITNSGSLITDITPNYGGYKGLLGGTLGAGVTMPYLSGRVIAEIATFNGVPRVAVTVNTGANWKFSAPVNVQANYIRTRRNDTQGKQLFVANGSLSLFCSDYTAATIVFNPKYFPGSLLRSIEVYG